MPKDERTTPRAPKEAVRGGQVPSPGAKNVPVPRITKPTAPPPKSK